MPEAVIERANELVRELSENDITFRVKDIAGAEQARETLQADVLELNQISLFDTVKDDDIIEELKEADIVHMTPVDALVTLQKLQNKIRNRYRP